MFLKIWKNPLFLFGVFIILFMVLGSLYFDYFIKDTLPEPSKFLYDKNNKLIATAPFPPSKEHIFGVNYRGEDVFYKIVEGAKYTITFAFIVGIARILLGFLLGVLYGTYLSRIYPYISGIISSFRYIPTTLVAIIFTAPIIFQMNYSRLEIVIFQFVILTLIALPTLSDLIGQEVGQIMKKEFITGAKILGGSNFHLVKKHLFPYLLPRLTVLFAQQIVAVLMLMMHLGVFRLFIGGTKISHDITGETSIISLSNEWSGLIGGSYSSLIVVPYIIYAPVLAFAITIIAMNLIVKGLEKSLIDYRPSTSKTKKKTSNKTDVKTNNRFEFITKKVS